MWDLPGPGLEPVSPALAGGLLTTAPPGKSGINMLLSQSLLFQNSDLVFRVSSVKNGPSALNVSEESG